MSIILSDALRTRHGAAHADLFGSARVVDRQSVIFLDSAHGLSRLRDSVVLQGAANITQDNGALCLRVHGGSDSVDLRSLELSAHQMACTVESSLAVEVDKAQFAGGQTLEFGLFDGADGYSFFYDGTGLSLRVYRGSSVTSIARPDFNGDYHSADPAINVDRGNIFRITHCHPYGCVLFAAVYAEAGGLQVTRVIHSYSPVDGQATYEARLPLRVVLQSNGGEGEVAVRLAGRQSSVIGRLASPTRITSSSVTPQAEPSETFVSAYRNTSRATCRLVGFDYVVPSGATDLRVYVLGDLADASFASMGPDSFLEQDTASTAFADGEQVHRALLAGAGTREGLDIYMPQGAALVVTSSGAAATLCLRFSEEH